MRARGQLMHAVGSIAGLTLLSRALGFLRWIIQAVTVGAGTVAGAYATANQVPNVLYEVVVGGALSATIVPLLASSIRTRRHGDTQDTVRALIGVVLLILTPLALILALAAGPIAHLFPVSASADPTTQYDLVRDFLRMFAAQIPLYGLGVVLTGVLHAHERFLWPALTPILSSGVVMAVYGGYGLMTAGAPDAPSHSALLLIGWGTTLGVAALSLPLLIPVARLGIPLRPHLRIRPDVARHALSLGTAGMGTLVAQQLSVLVVLGLARWGGQPGTPAVWQYTQAVYLLPYAVLTVPVATVMFPRLTTAVDEDPSCRPGTGAHDLASRSTTVIVAVASIGVGVLLAVSHAAELFFSRLTTVDGMGAALAAMAPGLLGYALIYHLTRVLFAASSARSAAVATATGWLCVTGVSWLLVHSVAARGGDAPATLQAVGWGNTVGMTVAGAGLMYACARRFSPASMRLPLRTLVLMLPTVALAGWAVRWAGMAVSGTLAVSQGGAVSPVPALWAASGTVAASGAAVWAEIGVTAVGALIVAAAAAWALARLSPETMHMLRARSAAAAPSTPLAPEEPHDA